MRYYFNVKDGVTMHDVEGMELDDLDAVKREAIQSSLDLIKDVRRTHFWKGEPWLLWVTDQPNGGGNTCLTLTFNAKLSV
jgi:hypothetical protein